MGLNTADRESVFIDLEQREYTEVRVPTILSRQSLRAGLNAIDDWIDDSMASFVAALPVDVKDNTTAKQKVAMLLHVINKRWEVE